MQIPPPILSDYAIEAVEAARKDPEGWFDSMDWKSLATLCRYAATLAFLGYERSALHSACELLESGQIAEAQTLIAFRARALDLLLFNLPDYGNNMVVMSTERERWPAMEKACLSMALSGTQNAFGAFDKPKQEKTK